MMNACAVAIAVRGAGLAAETIMITAGTVAAVRFLHADSAYRVQWIAIPGLLVVAALVPTWIRDREFPCIGLHGDDLGLALLTVGRLCVWVLPAVFLGLWILTRLHLSPPLQPIVAEHQNWTTWLFYQFFYVAVAEEVFFRGYVQANTMRWLRQACRLSETMQQSLAILVSAGCFAAAHVVVQGQLASALTFLPGVLLAWLFVRTHALLAPILFHGLANVSYAFLAATVA